MTIEADINTPEPTPTSPELDETSESSYYLDIVILVMAIFVFCFFRFWALNVCYGCFNQSLNQSVNQEERIPILKRQEQQLLRSRLFLFEDKDQPAVLAVY